LTGWFSGLSGHSGGVRIIEFSAFTELRQPRPVQHPTDLFALFDSALRGKLEKVTKSKQSRFDVQYTYSKCNDYLIFVLTV
jgi:hypothetical protein